MSASSTASSEANSASSRSSSVVAGGAEPGRHKQDQTGKKPQAQQQDDQLQNQRLLHIASETRTYAELMSELDESTEDFLTRNHLRHEKAWYEETSRKLDDSRRRWEDEVRLMREQFFTAQQAHPKQRERAAALMDAHTFDQLQTRTMRGSDGRLRFQVRFEVQGFETNQVEVGVRDLRLTIRANRECSVGGGSSFRQLVRSVNLPSNCLADQLTACITSDSVLIVVAPLRAPDSLGGQQHKCCGASSLASPADAPQLIDSGQKLVRLQVQLGPYYRPDEISVLIGCYRVKISARREEVREGRNSCCREFQRDYDLPEAVRPSATVAILAPGGCLTVEAPLETEAVSTIEGEGKAQQDDCQSLVSVISSSAAVESGAEQGAS